MDIDDRPLKRLQENLRRMEEGKEVPLAGLLTADFMAAHTAFPDVESFLNASGLFPDDAGGDDAAETIRTRRAELDAWVRKETACGSWDELLAAAAREYMQRELFRGVE